MSEQVEPSLRKLRRAALRWEMAAAAQVHASVLGLCESWLIVAAKRLYEQAGWMAEWPKAGESSLVDMGDGRIVFLDWTGVPEQQELKAWVLRPLAAGSLASRPAAETAETAERIRREIREAAAAPLRSEDPAQPIHVTAGEPIRMQTFTAGTTAAPLRGESLADQVERVKVQQEQRTTHRGLTLQLSTAAPLTVALTALLGFVFADPHTPGEDRIEELHTQLLKLADRERRQADAELLQRMAALGPKLEEALP